MFDPSGLKERYQKLVGWNGPWVNYWTETVARKKDTGAPIVDGEHGVKEEAKVKDNDAALIEIGIADPSAQPSDGSPVDSLESSATPSDTVNSSQIQAPESPTPADKVTTKATQKAEKEAAKTAQKAEKARVKEAKAADKALKKQHEAELKIKKDIIPPRHFIVLPTGVGRVLGGGENWEQIQIGGVQDEVAAHCGLFIRGQNLDYDGLVEKVGKKVLGWCEAIPPT